MTSAEIGQMVGLWAGVVLALVFSVINLRQTKKLQEKEHRQKLLDEIIDWAVEISNSCRVTFDDYDVEDTVSGRLAYANKLGYRNKLLENRGRYIKAVANRIDSTLDSAVKEVMVIISERKGLECEMARLNASLTLEEANQVEEICSCREGDTTGLSAGALNILALHRNYGSLNNVLDRIIEKAVDIKMQSIE